MQLSALLFFISYDGVDDADTGNKLVALLFFVLVWVFVRERGIFLAVFFSNRIPTENVLYVSHLSRTSNHDEKMILAVIQALLVL